RTPLFCLFGVHLYQDLAFALGGDRPVIGMHVPFRYVPGRDSRPTLADIATRYVDLIRRHQPHGPYHLLGLCFGGIVAYEVARQLETAGECVDSVAVIDAILPTAIRVDAGRRLRSYVDSAQRVLREPQDLERWVRKRGEALAARVPLLGRLKAAAGLVNGTKAIDLPIDGPEVEAEVRRFAVAASRVSARLLVVRAMAERTPDWMAVDPAHGWGERADVVRVHDIPADHLGVLREPHVQSLARVLVDVCC
ncbi:MAG TPA: thioesterase domain-containing protein, partial [Nannocystaceae bacterium]|nr:thioesterase domain-containing protein [Nannocystaceae bacterium]